MSSSMFREIAIKFIILEVIAVIGLAFFISFTLQGFLYSQTEEELGETLEILSHVFSGQQAAEEDALQKLCVTLAAGTKTRLTLILADGRVIGDSEESPVAMENHAGRPEVYKALTGRRGVANRFSSTLGRGMLYVAFPLDGEPENGPWGVLRASRAVSSIESRLDYLNLRLLLAGIVLLVVTVLISFLLARGINQPVRFLQQAASRYAQGDFRIKTRIENPAELKALSQVMNNMAEELKIRIMLIGQQKDKLEAILDHMVEPVILTDDDLLIHEINQAAAGLFLLDKTQVRGHSLIEVIRNIDLYDFARQVSSECRFRETAITLRQAQEIHLQVHATPLFNAEKLCSGILLVMNDITRLIKLENMRRVFVANVSHELKTPVTAIRGFVETLVGGALQDPVKAPEFLEIIRRQTVRLNTIIDDLLSLARLEEWEKTGIDREQHQPGELIAAAVKNCQPAADKKRITIGISGEYELSVNVNGFLVGQAIINLLDNAVKYSETGSRIELGYRIEHREKDWLLISVADSGCGIPAGDLPHIFERFYRVDKARSRALGGTGLGLSIVKHIALAHGGMVDVQSEPGQGSTFVLQLPLEN